MSASTAKIQSWKRNVLRADLKVSTDGESRMCCGSRFHVAEAATVKARNDVVEARSNVHIDEPPRSTADILKSLSHDR